MDRPYVRGAFSPLIPWVNGGVSRPGGQWLNVYGLCSEESKFFPGARPGDFGDQGD